MRSNRQRGRVRVHGRPEVVDIVTMEGWGSNTCAAAIGLCAFHTIAPADEAIEARPQQEQPGTCFGGSGCLESSDCYYVNDCENGERVTTCHFEEDVVDCDCRLDGEVLETFEYDPSREIVSCRTAQTDCILSGVW